MPNGFLDGSAAPNTVDGATFNDAPPGGSSMAAVEFSNGEPLSVPGVVLAFQEAPPAGKPVAGASFNGGSAAGVPSASAGFVDTPPNGIMDEALALEGGTEILTAGRDTIIIG